MRDDFDSAMRTDTGATEDVERVERRMFRVMCAGIACAVAASLFIAERRTTTGLLIGGALAILNYSWLRSSLAAIFGNYAANAAPAEIDKAAADENAKVKPRLSPARFVLRYAVVAAAVWLAYSLRIASLAAMLWGLGAFALAGVIEGFIQVYLVIVNGKEI